MLEADLTFAKANDICLASANVNQAVKENKVLYTKTFQKHYPKQNSMYIDQKFRKPSGKWFLCEGNHYKSVCKSKGAVCNNCNKKGLIQKVCRNNKKPFTKSSKSNLIAWNSDSRQNKMCESNSDFEVLQINNKYKIYLRS